MPRRITIRTNILAHFLFVVLAVAGGLLWLQYHFDRKMALDATKAHFKAVAEKVAGHLRDRQSVARAVLHYLTFEKPPEDPLHIGDEEMLRYLDVLRHNRAIRAVEIGFPDGGFFQLFRIDPRHRPRNVPREARWGILRIFGDGGEREMRLAYTDDGLRILSQSAGPSRFDATARPWYVEALQAGGIVRTGVYRFENLGEMGLTFASPFRDGRTVLALDLTLQDIDRMLASIRFAPTAAIYLFDEGGMVVASSDGSRRLPEALRRLAEEGCSGEVAETEGVLAMIQPFDTKARHPLYIGVAMRSDVAMAPYMRQISYAILTALALLALSLPLILSATRRIVRPVRALMAENEKIKARRYDEVRPIESNIVEFAELSDSLLAMARSIRRYERSLKEMMKSFIRLIAGAIDAKSPYTGGHCRRVPELAKMLAEAAQASDEGVCRGFAFANEEAFEAFEMGAWLHDCGKITTPEFVVDKATKLETLYNRIHEVRMRFEVLWRDLEITYLRRLMEGEEKEALQAWLESERRRLQEDFAFVAECNLGSEAMDPARKARLKEIARRTWMRHFDDRLGLSDVELRRYAESPPQPLPVEEPLLADRPEHIEERTGFDEEAYRKKGFKLEVPRHLYNRGELYNLGVERGTLTPEERFKIEEHVIMTIEMLEQLPYPEGMERIPEYAGTHHETLDGTGYPRRLDASSLSIPARIMAIADIFEALTASDRPYKKSKTLSESLRIMAKMVAEGRLDAELFTLFIRRKIYLRYARAHLGPGQIDEVDEEKILQLATKETR